MHCNRFLLNTLTMFTIAGTAFAADPPVTGFRPASPAIKTAPGLPATGVVATPVPGALAPLKQKLTMQMAPLQPLSPCITVPAAIDAVLKKDLEAREVLHASGVNGQFPLGRGKLQSYFLPSVKGCCSPGKEYSVQDQQAAGCVGSESLNACLDKVTRSCIAKYAQTWHIKQDAQKLQQSASAVSTASGQFAQALQQFAATVP